MEVKAESNKKSSRKEKKRRGRLIELLLKGTLRRKPKAIDAFAVRKRCSMWGTVECREERRGKRVTWRAACHGYR